MCSSKFVMLSSMNNLQDFQIQIPNTNSLETLMEIQICSIFFPMNCSKDIYSEIELYKNMMPHISTSKLIRT